jgi:5-methylcytosine-specific restriction protein A
MPRALKTCATPGCPELVERGRCTKHDKQGDRERGTAWQRGYRTAHTRSFRPAVLLRDPVCVCDATNTHGHGAKCYRASTVADHWPLSKRELIERGMDSDDPKHGRGLCKPCHDGETAVNQPGGWHGRHSG